MNRVIVVIACAAVAANILAAQPPSAPAPQPAAAGLPAPKTPLAMQILQPPIEWIKYYDTATPDTVQVYYNIHTIIRAFNEQQKRIEALEAQVKELQAKLAGAAPEPKPAEVKP